MSDPENTTKRSLFGSLREAFEIKRVAVDDEGLPVVEPTAPKVPTRRVPRATKPVEEDTRSELDRLLQEQEAGRPSAPTPQNPVVANALEIGMPFQDIYDLAGVPAVSYTAEQLLKVITGIASLPEEMRGQTLKALDDADDSWSLESVKVDASHKIDALRKAAEKLTGALASEEAQLERHRADIRSGAQKVLDDVAAKRAALEAQYQKNLNVLSAQEAEAEQLMATENSRIDSSLHNARESTSNEMKRLTDQQRRLNYILTL